jgi:hypothetical protein
MTEPRIESLKKEHDRLKAELERIDAELKKMAEQKQGEMQRADAKRTGKLSK